MGGQDSPELIARYRSVRAASVIANEVDLRGYPYPYLQVRSDRGGDLDRAANAVIAAEQLSHQGWELVNMFTTGRSDMIIALLRRR